MPNFDVTIGGRTYHVDVPDPGATPLQVIVDGQAFEVEIAGTEAWVAPQAVLVPTSVPLSAPRRMPAPQAAPSTGAQVEEISAPMPGTILSLEVQPGQQVEPGQVVCVLEAMKMKNPIRAAHRGIVVQTAVRVGQNVSHGDLLVKLS
jgi:glutaconyl-CoA/methylmalonyl-CoA decarboxylase subunit gamma